MSKEVKPVSIYKWEYNNFLEFVKKRKVGRAIIYAKALQIDRRTLVHWLSQPELREAMVEAIDELVDGMQRAGSKDWRMYRELMEIMGIDKEQKMDITSNGEALNIIIDNSYDRKPKFRTDNNAAATDGLAENSSQ
jgi:hypothetical protein